MMNFLRFRRRKDKKRGRNAQDRHNGCDGPGGGIVGACGGLMEGTEIIAPPFLNRAQKQRMFLGKLQKLSQMHLDHVSSSSGSESTASSDSTPWEVIQKRQQLRDQGFVENRHAQKKYPMSEGGGVFDGTALLSQQTSFDVSTAIASIFTICTRGDAACGEEKDALVTDEIVSVDSSERTKVPSSIRFSPRESSNAGSSLPSDFSNHPDPLPEEGSFPFSSPSSTPSASLVASRRMDRYTSAATGKHSGTSLLDSILVLEETVVNDVQDRYAADHISMTSSLSTHPSHDLP